MILVPEHRAVVCEALEVMSSTIDSDLWYRTGELLDTADFGEQSRDRTEQFWREGEYNLALVQCFSEYCLDRSQSSEWSLSWQPLQWAFSFFSLPSVRILKKELGCQNRVAESLVSFFTGSIAHFVLSCHPCISSEHIMQGRSSAQ